MDYISERLGQLVQEVLQGKDANCFGIRLERDLQDIVEAFLGSRLALSMARGGSYMETKCRVPIADLHGL